MEMEKRTPRVESRKAKGRDKLQMAWRHKSRSEKNLIRAIGFLVFALICFIIAVIAMDLGFKAKIKSLEDQIDDLKSDAPNATAIYSTTDEPDYNTTASITTTEEETITTPETTDTTTIPTTPPPSTTSTTLETDSSKSSESTETATPPQEAIFEALRSLLTNFSGLKSSTSSIEKTSHRGSITSRSRGTFIIMADINHEESMTPDPTGTPDPFVYIDSNGSASGFPPEEEDQEHVNNSTSMLDLDSLFDDTEEELETTTEGLDGSGDGSR